MLTILLTISKKMELKVMLKSCILRVYNEVYRIGPAVVDKLEATWFKVLMLLAQRFSTPGLYKYPAYNSVFTY